MTRRAAKVDDNQSELVAEFERMGCAVHSLAGVGDGFPDLIVWDGDRHHLVEVKAIGGKLTAKQVKFFSEWPGPIHIVKRPVDVIALAQEWGNA
jgi:Holliday junction resolvase